MSQPDMEPMNTTEAEGAIESFLTENPLLEGGEVEEEEALEGEVATEDEEDDEESSESEEKAESEKETDDEAQESIETLSDLAEALELSEEEVMANLKTTVKVNGEEMTVTLKEAFDGYQKDADYRQKTTELSIQRRTLEEQTAGARQQLQEQLTQAGQLMQALQQAVVPDLNPQEMEYLKQADPQSYLIKMQEHQERVNQFNQIRQQGANQYAQNQQQLTQQQETQRQEIMTRAAEEIQVRIPDWGKEVATATDNYLMGEGYGYTAEELSQVIDPRLIEIAHKARLYDEQSKKADIVTKKVKTLPKVQPKGALKSVKASSGKLKSAKARLRKSGSIDDAASAVEQLLFNS